MHVNVGCRMNTKTGEFDLYLLACRKHLVETVDVFVLGMDGHVTFFSACIFLSLLQSLLHCPR